MKILNPASCRCVIAIVRLLLTHNPNSIFVIISQQPREENITSSNKQRRSSIYRFYRRMNLSIVDIGRASFQMHTQMVWIS